MTTVKFDKSVKYNGVRYAAHEVFKVIDEDVPQLKAAGATVLSVEPAVNPDEGKQPECNQEDTAELKESLLDYTVPQLIEFAEERNIDLQGKTRKADIYNMIVATLN
jgi:hypothetical protein